MTRIISYTFLPGVCLCQQSVQITNEVKKKNKKQDVRKTQVVCTSCRLDSREDVRRERSIRSPPLSWISWEEVDKGEEKEEEEWEEEQEEEELSLAVNGARVAS